MISIIVPVYNQLDFTKVCLESVVEMSKSYQYELIVVANGCVDGTESYLDLFQKDCPNTIVCKISQPIGYARAINVGIQLSHGDHIVLLNNDTKILGPEWIDLLRTPFENDSLVGITGPLSLYSEEANIEFLVFFCVMISRVVFNTIGLLDTAFGVGYGEDIDFCKRAMSVGFKLTRVPSDPPIVVGHMNISKFPIWHYGEGTVHTLEDWASIVNMNKNLLRKRYLYKSF